MKYLKRYNESSSTKEFIDSFCKEQGIWKYTINKDYSIDVSGNVTIRVDNPFDKGELPIQFGDVSGFFNCALCGLTSFKGFPKNIGDYLSVQNNKITSLDYFPESTGRLITLEDNNLRDVSKIKNLFSDPNKIVWIDNNPIDQLIYQLVIMGCSKYKGFINNERSDIQFDVIDRLDEFDVIKDDKIDMISLNSMFDYYSVRFNENIISELVKECGYEIC